MTKTQQNLIARALDNGGRSVVIQSWGRTPNGGSVRSSHKRELRSLKSLIDGYFVTYARFPAAPEKLHTSTANGYTAFTVEHIYTVTDHGRAAYQAFKRATA